LTIPLQGRLAVLANRYIDKDVIFGIRPEHLSNEVKNQSHVPIKSTVEIAEPMGSESLVYLKAGSGNLIARIHGEHLYHLGEPVTVQLNLSRSSLSGNEFACYRAADQPGCRQDHGYMEQTGTQEGYQRDSIERPSPFKTQVRTCSKRWVPRSVHPIMSDPYRPPVHLQAAFIHHLRDHRASGRDSQLCKNATQVGGYRPHGFGRITLGNHTPDLGLTRAK
jgi:hypothetical protein